MQTVGIATAFHDTTGLLIHDFHLVIHQHVVDIFFEKGIGFQQLIDGVNALAFDAVIAHQIIFCFQFFFVRFFAVFDFGNFRAQIRQQEETIIFHVFGDELNALFGEFDLIVFFVDHEEELCINLRHIPLVVLQVLAFRLE